MGNVLLKKHLRRNSDLIAISDYLNSFVHLCVNSRNKSSQNHETIINGFWRYYIIQTAPNFIESKVYRLIKSITDRL